MTTLDTEMMPRRFPAATTLAVLGSLTSGGAAAQNGGTVVEVFGHDIHVSGARGDQALVIDGGDMLSGGRVMIWEIGLLGSTPYLLGDVGPGGNMCASTPFVVSFDGPDPEVDIFPEECLSPPHEVDGDRIVFAIPAEAGGSRRAWAWTAGDGFEEVAVEEADAAGIAPPEPAPAEYVHPEASDYPEVAPAPHLGPAPEPSRWRVTTSSNPIDDSPIVVLATDSISGRNARGESISFVARCRSNTTEAYVVWNDYLADDSPLGRGSWKHVTVRIGDAPASQERWDTSTDHQATFAPGWAGNLLKRMMGEERLVVRTTPYNENPITAVFDIRGMETGLRELAETCNWSF